MKGSKNNKKSQKSNANPFAGAKSSGGSGGNNKGKAENAPAAVSRVYRNKKPNMKSANNNFCVRHRELVTTVASSTPFAVVSFHINPGNASLFPWLSKQATSWEQYRVKSMALHYIPRCSTQTAGTVLLAPDYDASDPEPASEQTASSYLGAVEDAAWKEIHLKLDPKAMHSMGPRKFVRGGPVGGDIKTFDAGVLYLCTVGFDSGAGDVGKLWVEYEVEFSVPQTDSRGLYIPQGYVELRAGTDQAISTGTGHYALWTQSILNGPGIVGDLVGHIPLPAGTWEITAVCSIKCTGSLANGQVVMLVNDTATVPDTSYIMNTGDPTQEVLITVLGVVFSDGTTTIAMEFIANGTGVLNIGASSRLRMRLL
jgi:hypothetical protein